MKAKWEPEEHVLSVVGPECFGALSGSVENRAEVNFRAVVDWFYVDDNDIRRHSQPPLSSRKVRS